MKLRRIKKVDNGGDIISYIAHLANGSCKLGGGKSLLAQSGRQLACLTIESGEHGHTDVIQFHDGANEGRVCYRTFLLCTKILIVITYDS